MFSYIGAIFLSYATQNIVFSFLQFAIPTPVTSTRSFHLPSISASKPQAISSLRLKVSVFLASSSQTSSSQYLLPPRQLESHLPKMQPPSNGRHSGGVGAARLLLRKGRAEALRAKTERERGVTKDSLGLIPFEQDGHRRIMQSTKNRYQAFLDEYSEQVYMLPLCSSCCSFH